MTATITTFGEWHDHKGDPWDAARGTFYPDFDHGGGVTPAAALQSSLYPNAPLAFLMSAPEIRLVVALFVVHPLPGSGDPHIIMALVVTQLRVSYLLLQVGLKSVLHQWTHGCLYQPMHQQPG